MWEKIALWAAVFWAGAVAGNVDSVIRQGESMRETWEMQESVLTESCRTRLVRSSFSGVPYFRDDTGKLLQEEDGYFYSYWGGVLARYDVDTLEREVLYEAASEQDGKLFCMDGEYIYFLEIPNISPYGKKSILYRVKKDGTGLTVLDENVPDAGMYDGGAGCYQEYTAMDIEKDILYLMHDEIVVCYRIKPEGGVEQTDMADTLYGLVPEGFRTPHTGGSYLSYWNLPSIPYCAGNFGYFFACSEEYGWLIRVDAESGIVENMTAGLPESLRYYDHLQLTHDSLFYSVDRKSWMRRGLESGSEWEKWYESDQELRFCSYDENGMYFEAWTEGETEGRSGVWSLYRINWEGEPACLFSMEGEQYFSEYPMGFPMKRFFVLGDYLYYFAVTEQGEGIYRLPLAEAERGADVLPQLVWYDENETNEIGYTESVKTGPKGDVIALPTQFDKLYLYEQGEAERKINAFLKKLYREYEAALAEENEAFCRDFAEEWEGLQELWEGWYSKDNPDMEEQEQKRVIAEQSTIEIGVSISYVSEAYLVVALSEYAYRFPGAHGMYWDDYYVFDRRTGERLTLLDFVDNTEEEVEELVSTYLELCGLPSDAEGIAQEPERFFLTAEGIGIHFDVYELSSYASGAHDIIIPYAEFRIREGMIP